MKSYFNFLSRNKLYTAIVHANIGYDLGTRNVCHVGIL